MTTDLMASDKAPHWEINEDGVRSRHPGYRETPCEKCKRPIIRSWMVKIEPNCGRRNEDRLSCVGYSELGHLSSNGVGNLVYWEFMVLAWVNLLV